jgi:adenine-specific DNA-methyltransferase
VRYIGNKTRLLDFIQQKLARRGITGSAVDPFSGTASVGHRLKGLGFRVTASDIMTYGYVFARAYVAAPTLPAAPGLADEVLAVEGRDAPALADIVAYLNGLDPLPDFVHRHFSPEGSGGREHGRMYFTPENAARIDHIRNRIEEWRRAGRIGDDAFHLLLAALLEAADAVANTTGVYASFVKSWQPNARRRLRLKVPAIHEGNGCRAERKDALELVADLEPFDLLYLDPPYNNRQYPGYYHVPELIAEGWFDGEPELRGKTGLAPDTEKRSDWSRAGKCEEAFEDPRRHRPLAAPGHELQRRGDHPRSHHRAGATGTWTEGYVPALQPQLQTLPLRRRLGGAEVQGGPGQRVPILRHTLTRAVSVWRVRVRLFPEGRPEAPGQGPRSCFASGKSRTRQTDTDTAVFQRSGTQRSCQ